MKTWRSACATPGAYWRRWQSCTDVIFSEEYRKHTGFAIEDYCYYLERPFENTMRLRRLYDRIGDIVSAWTAAHAAQRAWLHKDGPSDADGATIRDRRHSDEKVHRLGSAATSVLDACTRPVSLRDLRAAGVPRVAPGALDAAVDALDELGLIFREGRRLGSLVLSGPPAELPLAAQAPVQSALSPSAG